MIDGKGGEAKIIHLKHRDRTEQPKTQASVVIDEEQRRKNELTFHENLTQLGTTFLEIRQKMGVGSNVGFGMLPDLHRGFSMGRLIPLRRTADNHWEYARDDMMMEVEWVRLSEENEKNIIVPPESSAEKMWLVSLYQLAPNPDQGVDERALHLNQSIWEGLIAHELSHLYFLGLNPPPFVPELQQRRQEEFKKAVAAKDPEVFDKFDLTIESTIDIIAAKMGYKEQILAKLHYMIDFWRSFTDKGGTLHPLMKSPERAIQDLAPRLNEVLRYS